MLSVKKSQPQLYEDIAETFSLDLENISHDFSETVDKGHGRIEARKCRVISEPDYLNYVNEGGRWKNLSSIAMVELERRVACEMTVESRFYISSLQNDAERLLATTRRHWSTENSLHWVLDISFREDESRVREVNAHENLAVIRHMALNVLKQDRIVKASIKGKCMLMNRLIHGQQPE